MYICYGFDLLELVHTSDANASAKIRKHEWTVSTQTQVPMQQIKWESINQSTLFCSKRGARDISETDDLVALCKVKLKI